MFVDLVMPGNWLGNFGVWVLVPVVFPTVTNEQAAFLF